MSANNVVCVYEEIPLDPYITHVVDTYSSMDHKHGTRCDALLLKKVLSNRLGVDAMGNLVPDEEEDQPSSEQKQKKEPAGLAAYSAAASSSAGAVTPRERFAPHHEEVLQELQGVEKSKP